jgi:hypothetical protein
MSPAILAVTPRARQVKAPSAELGYWGAMEQNAELGILFQILSVVKSGVELANALWAGIR